MTPYSWGVVSTAAGSPAASTLDDAPSDAGARAQRRRRLRADARRLPLRPALLGDRRRRADRRPDPRLCRRSAGCRACSGSPSASCSSARCTTSRRSPRRCATAATRSPRSRASTLGTRAGRAMMAFIWIALVYVIVAFTDITAGSFVGGTEELARRSGVPPRRRGRARRASCTSARRSCSGLVERFLKPPLWLPRRRSSSRRRFAVCWLGTQRLARLRRSHASLGAGDPRLLRGRVGPAGLGAAAAARLPRRLRALRRRSRSASSASSSAATRSSSRRSGGWDDRRRRPGRSSRSCS